MFFKITQLAIERKRQKIEELQMFAVTPKHKNVRQNSGSKLITNQGQGTHVSKGQMSFEALTG